MYVRNHVEYLYHKTSKVKKARCALDCAPRFRGHVTHLQMCLVERLSSQGLGSARVVPGLVN
jgi:hypothetical protein